MHMEKIMYGLPHIKIPKKSCKECCEMKQIRKSFKHDLPMKSNHKFEIIHLEAYDPFKVKSMGGKYYFPKLIEEFTRLIWIYLMEKKNEVFTQFKKFKLLTEKTR